MNTVLITGASRGIGAAAVRAFAKAGWRVAFTYLRNEEAAKALSQETGALAIKADAGDRAQTQSAFLQAQQAFHHIDALVCCAGIAHSALCQDVTQADWDRLLAVNLSGAYFAAQAALPSMISQQYGRIVFLGSMWGQLGAAMEVAYSATKAGVIGLGRALSREVAPSGVTVNIVSPGAIDTDMLDCYSEKEKQVIAQDTPMGRLGTPDEVASAILYLCSRDAGYITGQVLGVNGGRI